MVSNVQLGEIAFENGKLVYAVVKDKTTQLYPNAMDPQDVAVADRR